MTASYLSNRVPHSALHNGTPYKALYGKEADLRHLRAIESRDFVHVETHTKKLDDRAWGERLVGYCTDSTSFRVYQPGTRKARESRNIVFIKTLSVMPVPDVVSGFDKGIFSYDEPDDFVRDMRH